jgi:hypothetical protein
MAGQKRVHIQFRGGGEMAEGQALGDGSVDFADETDGFAVPQNAPAGAAGETLAVVGLNPHGFGAVESAQRGFDDAADVMQIAAGTGDGSLLIYLSIFDGEDRADLK